MTGRGRLLRAAVIWSVGVLLTGNATAQQRYESYFMYLGDHPTEVENFWSHEAQRVTRDATHWYLTQNSVEGVIPHLNPRLWKVPVGDDLSASNPSSGTVSRTMHSYSILSILGYNHFGDLTYHEFDGQGYLFIAITGDGPCPAVAVFRPDLSYIDHACISKYASWAALDSNNLLYVGVIQGNLSALYRYTVTWECLAPPDNDLVLSKETEIQLLDGAGNPFAVSDPQGGVFSPRGDLLYTTTGVLGGSASAHGIHVFATASWRRVRQSTNGCGTFNFAFDPDSPVSHEPEGLTIWGLEDGRAPGIRGKLHVILLDNDLSFDDVYLKHYAETIYVDGAYQGVPIGTPTRPFPLVAMANNVAWDGARIGIRAGSYAETLTIDHRVRISATGGVARIGD